MKTKPTKMRIPFDDGLIVGEVLWVTPLRHDNFRIENNPTCGFLFYRDIVKAVEVDGVLTFQSLVIRGKPESS
jgi:hypothetical protein